ncbi:MAG TPA: hypothetical protein PLA19_02535 [Candidatus Pacearchaeota archaeon]|nr:hypothetical protein [Candidatus Pacearchaeota archaeon]
MKTPKGNLFGFFSYRDYRVCHKDQLGHFLKDVLGRSLPRREAVSGLILIGVVPPDIAK